MRRRRFLKWTFSSVVPFLVPRWLRARVGALAPADVPAGEITQLHELASVVLPTSFGRARADGIADNFVKWIRGYRAGADLGHGYGLTKPRVAPPNPATNYPAQLRELESAARAKGATFAKLDRAAQREVVAAALERAKIQNIPRRPNGKNVAADLMSFFFYGPDGEDFLYQAAIHREECRGLPSSGQRPASLR
jgi:hypothetical protein